MSRKLEHGEGTTKLYRVWSEMKERCRNPHRHNYENYGGRGIDVCDEWANSYLTFKEWAISNGYCEGKAIDRIDNEKGYCPENCRWATQKEQQRNKRNNRLVTLNGETKTLAEWSEITGINHGVLWNRIFHLGWSIEKAFATPPHGNTYHKPRVDKMKAVHQCDEDGNILATFASIKDASETTGINRSNISSVIHGRRKKAEGYYWEFATEGGMNSEFIRNK